MNAGSVVGTKWGGDTETLIFAKEFVWTFCTDRQQGCKNFVPECECSCYHLHPSHLVEFPLPNFSNSFFCWQRFNLWLKLFNLSVWLINKYSLTAWIKLEMGLRLQFRNVSNLFPQKCFQLSILLIQLFTLTVYF